MLIPRPMMKVVQTDRVHGVIPMPILTLPMIVLAQAGFAVIEIREGGQSFYVYLVVNLKPLNAMGQTVILLTRRVFKLPFRECFFRTVAVNAVTVFLLFCSGDALCITGFQRIISSEDGSI